VSKDKNDVVFSAKISEPIPAKDAFNPDHDTFDEWENEFEKSFRIGFDILVYKDFSILRQDADIHFSCMQIDAAVIVVLLFVKSHRLASFG
jgi:hypothetical protein